jgi:hypothetical protein
MQCIPFAVLCCDPTEVFLYLWFPCALLYSLRLVVLWCDTGKSKKTAGETSLEEKKQKQSSTGDVSHSVEVALGSMAQQARQGEALQVVNAETKFSPRGPCKGPKARQEIGKRQLRPRQIAPSLWSYFTSGNIEDGMPSILQKLGSGEAVYVPTVVV